ncbi:hypothetical protein ENKNEFLB_02088 [Nocardioides aquaticus]|uniref:Helix-turn-helix domain-containing protein n=1 Tax=Nocardioides aquaticus TaxID=160826 RepID=A0ABX8EM44_9ACTN|nr:helix-turn-helix domain-containing protein [Nocardioides aquaticus]QVT79698.1 hypothetical protein ENKNEFLB_02088 [Nocardioides aquaticus]
MQRVHEAERQLLEAEQAYHQACVARRELIADLAASGHRVKYIAEALSVSPATVYEIVKLVKEGGKRRDSERELARSLRRRNEDLRARITELTSSQG